MPLIKSDFYISIQWSTAIIRISFMQFEAFKVVISVMVNDCCSP